MGTQTRGQAVASQQSASVCSRLRCRACGGPKEAWRFFCRACWVLLPRDFRRRLFATRYKPVKHAWAISTAIAQIKYGEPEPTLFSALDHGGTGGLP